MLAEMGTAISWNTTTVHGMRTEYEKCIGNCPKDHVESKRPSPPPKPSPSPPTINMRPLAWPLFPLAVSAISYADENRLLRGGIPQIGRFQHLSNLQESNRWEASLSDSQTVFSQSEKQFPSHCHYQPVSHFIQDPSDPFYQATINQTFCQRYWFDAKYYKPGGPVFVLDGGETSGENRLDFLRTGIIKRLAEVSSLLHVRDTFRTLTSISTQEYNGLPVVLEHRYYGESFPFGPKSNLSTDSLRFLNNKEALEDSAQFIRTVKFEGLDVDLTGGEGKPTRWIY